MSFTYKTEYAKLIEAQNNNDTELTLWGHTFTEVQWQDDKTFICEACEGGYQVKVEHSPHYMYVDIYYANDKDPFQRPSLKKRCTIGSGSFNPKDLLDTYLVNTWKKYMTNDRSNPHRGNIMSWEKTQAV